MSENFDRLCADLNEKLDRIDSKMDSVIETVNDFRVALVKVEVKLNEHIKNIFIHISKWWVMPSAAIMTAAAIAAFWK